MTEFEKADLFPQFLRDIAFWRNTQLINDFALSQFEEISAGESVFNKSRNGSFTADFLEPFDTALGIPGAGGWRGRLGGRLFGMQLGQQQTTGAFVQLQVFAQFFFAELQQVFARHGVFHE